MRLSNLLWLVALFIVLRARPSRQHPKMYGRRYDLRPRRHHKYFDSAVDGRRHYHSQYRDKKWVAAQEDTFQDNNCEALPKQNIAGGNNCNLPNQAYPTSCQSSNAPNNAPNNASPLSSHSDCNTQPVHHQSQQQQQQPQQHNPCANQQYPIQSSQVEYPQTQSQPQQPQQQQQQQQQQQPQQQQPQPQQPQFEPDDSELRGRELRKLVQHLYVAQARVQLEATEIHKAQAVASSAQSQLEDSANHVRTITATLHNAQQEVAAAAIRAQIAQLQLAAHDQLLFAARQDVDALSSQVVGLQAAEGIVQPKLTVDLHALLDKLRQPLQHFDRPTPVPTIITMPPLQEMPPVPAPVNDDLYLADPGAGAGAVADAEAKHIYS